MKIKIDQSLNIIHSAIEKYKKIAVACSFGKDSVVILHLARVIKPDIQVFSVMTPFKPMETLHYKEYLSALWGLNIKTYMHPTNFPGDMYKTDPNECCRIFKVNPTREAIEDLKLDAWISGLRATEGPTRRNLPVIQSDKGLDKINPILEWTEAEIWLYHAIYNIPVHPLYLQGYRSLGCFPCSGIGGEHERSERWKGTNKCGGECGIHTYGLKTGEKILHE
jgi:phosphoadenosine phosphosulfate reductase